MIINSEWGAFGENGSLNEIVTPFDRILDSKSVNPTKQIFEKMISGLYLGELVRITLVHLVESKLLFNGEHLTELSVQWSFTTAMVSDIESNDDNIMVSTILKDTFAIANPSEDDLYIVRLTCERISSRGAKLVASGLVAIALRQTNQEEVVVGYDGSVMKKHPKFKQIVETTVTKLLDEIRTQNINSDNQQGPTTTTNNTTTKATQDSKTTTDTTTKVIQNTSNTTDTTVKITSKSIPKRMRFVESHDGSGRGAAVVAAVAYRDRRPKIAVRSMRDRDGHEHVCVIEFSSYPTKFPTSRG